ncbi:MAG: [FeFe] hydrogenase H-cluster maturation GTPase HydF [Hyphomicrobiales bacterium]
MKTKGREIKPHIAVFGRRNNGKSSLINSLAQQELSIVSDVAGTTTDPVKKSIEIEGVGPAVLIDTAGIDDFGELGEKRNKRSLSIIQTIDLAILIITSNEFSVYEENLIKQFADYDVPFFIVSNKSDLERLSADLKSDLEEKYQTQVYEFSSYNNDDPHFIYNLIKESIPESAYVKPSLFGGLVGKNDLIMLITPIDSEAPEGRMILPQVQAIRDVLDNDGICIVLKETEVEHFLKTFPVKPKLAVTDSQVFGMMDKLIPEDIPLTGFSVVLARMKGCFDEYIQGTKHIENLKDGDTILLLESCTHHVSCDDIGRHKIPNWIKKYTGKNLNFEVVPGLANIPKAINEYAMVIQCGGCVITGKQLTSRLKPAIKADVPVTNYGMVIAYLNGMFKRAVKPFENL